MPKRDPATNPNAMVTPAAKRPAPNCDGADRRPVDPSDRALGHIPLVVQCDPLVVAAQWVSWCDDVQSLPPTPPLSAMVLHMLHAAAFERSFALMKNNIWRDAVPSWVRCVSLTCGDPSPLLRGHHPRVRRIEGSALEGRLSLAGNPQVTSVTLIPSRQFTELSSLLDVAACANLWRLHIPSRPVTDLDGLDKAVHLEDLRVEFCFTDDFNVISSCHKLRQLRLGWYPARSLDAFSGLLALEVLEFNPAPPWIDFTPLCHLPRLRRLSSAGALVFRGSHVPPALAFVDCRILPQDAVSFQRVLSLPALTDANLEVSHLTPLVDLKSTAALRKLKLRFPREKAQNVDLAHLRAEECILQRLVENSAFKNPQRNTWISILTLDDCSVDTESLGTFAKMPALCTLRISDNSSPAWLDLGSLRSSKTLTALSIVRARVMNLASLLRAVALRNLKLEQFFDGMDKNADELVQAASEFHRLRSLTIRYPYRWFNGSVPPALDLAVLQHSPTLTELHIAAYPIVESSISAIATLPHLRRLTLLPTEALSDVSTVSRLRHLESLSLNVALSARGADEYAESERWISGSDFRLLDCAYEWPHAH